MAYQKYMHFVWIGSGTPSAADQNYLRQWAKLTGGAYGWRLILWTNDLMRPWCPGYSGIADGATAETGNQIIERKSYLSDVFLAGMKRTVGETVWRELLAIIEDEKTPTPNDLTTRSMIEATVDAKGEKRNLGHGANYAAASDIVRVAALCLFGGFYTDIASYPGVYTSSLSAGAIGQVTPTSFQLFNELATSPTETTVLWVADKGEWFVNNAFLGASSSDKPFWIYFLKSMHKIYNDLVYKPDKASVEVFFKHLARTSKKRKLNKNKLKLRAGNNLKGFMRNMKRLAFRGMTLYTSGPYLIRCCLERYYVTLAAQTRKALPTVADVCAHVELLEREKGSDKMRERILAQSRSITTPPKVNFEPQTHRIQKVQRNSWDQKSVQDFFVGVYDEVEEVL